MLLFSAPNNFASISLSTLVFIDVFYGLHRAPFLNILPDSVQPGISACFILLSSHGNVAGFKLLGKGTFPYDKCRGMFI